MGAAMKICWLCEQTKITKIAHDLFLLPHLKEQLNRNLRIECYVPCEFRDDKYQCKSRYYLVNRRYIEDDGYIIIGCLFKYKDDREYLSAEILQNLE